MADLKHWYDRFVTENASKSILDAEEIESAVDLLLADQKTLDLLSQSLKSVPRQKFLNFIQSCKVCCPPPK